MKIRKPFGQLQNGQEFEYAGRPFIKLDDFNARTTVSRGKESFLFFKRDLVSIEPSPSISHSDILSNDKSTLFSAFDKAMIEGYKIPRLLEGLTMDNFACDSAPDPEPIEEEPKEQFWILKGIQITGLPPSISDKNSKYILEYRIQFINDDGKKAHIPMKVSLTYDELENFTHTLPKFLWRSHFGDKCKDVQEVVELVVSFEPGGEFSVHNKQQSPDVSNYFNFSFSQYVRTNFINGVINGDTVNLSVQNGRQHSRFLFMNHSYSEDW